MTISQLPSLLHSEGYISQQQRAQYDLNGAQPGAKSSTRDHQKLIETLLKQSGLSADELRDLIAHRFSYPIVYLSKIEPQQVILLPHLTELCVAHLAIPLQLASATITIATVDPTNPDLEQEFHFATQQNVNLALCSMEELTLHYQNALGEQWHSHSVSSNNDDGTRLKINDTQRQQYVSSDNALDRSPISQYILQVLKEGYEQGCSDIHFEPYQHRYRIRYRCDGILREIPSPPQSFSSRLTSRLKVMANLDIAQQRFPQDGRIDVALSDSLSAEYRVSTLPTHWGEKVVLRCTQSQAVHALSELGMNSLQYPLMLAALEQPQGMILITGPTGSGKSQTLYAALQHLNQEHRNISTAEDPVEMQLDGINQVQLHHGIGLNYHQSLRAFLRQDPDVMMVGEIRDADTAKTAVKAAQTGHLLLSTLHTNSAQETLTRLINLGIQPHNLASSINLIVAQRLLRLLCEHCKTPQALELKDSSKPFLQSLNQQPINTTSLFQANDNGCAHCHQGYKGRMAIFELLPITKTIQRALLHASESFALEQSIEKCGQPTLRDSGLQALLDGRTSIAELKRVLGLH
jgi:type IV pilus assembly protein PilB